MNEYLLAAVAKGALFIVVLMLILIYYISPRFILDYIDAPKTTATTTLSPTTTSTSTSTTVSSSTTTSTTMPTTTTTSKFFQYASMEEEGTTEWLEKRTFDLVNDERLDAGLMPLTWNEEITEVCRGHSTDMAVREYFAHESPEGDNVKQRLNNAGIYYWNHSGENIALLGFVKSRLVNRFGDAIETEYYTFEEMAQRAAEGWMDSPGHRENILRPEYDEAGMGVVYANESYYFTQDFISRAECGYFNGPCCEDGIYVLCFVPYTCEDMVCVEEALGVPF